MKEDERLELIKQMGAQLGAYDAAHSLAQWELARVQLLRLYAMLGFLVMDIDEHDPVG